MACFENKDRWKATGHVFSTVGVAILASFPVLRRYRARIEYLENLRYELKMGGRADNGEFSDWDEEQGGFVIDESGEEWGEVDSSAEK